MIVTVIGVVADRIGHIRQVGAVATQDAFLLRSRNFAQPAYHYRTVQPESIVVDVEHERPVGHVEHLERDPKGRLWAVATAALADNERFGVWWWSPSTDSTPDHRDVELVSLALTKQPASVTVPPVRLLGGDLTELRDRDHLKSTATGLESGLLTRAAETIESRRFHRGALIVHDNPAAESMRLADERDARGDRLMVRRDGERVMKGAPGRVLAVRL